jgi:hypothetical protein
MILDAFDIFRVETHGVRWLESAATLDDAKSRIQQLNAVQHGDYVVLNHVTGIKTVFTSGHVSTESATSSPSVYEQAAGMAS